MPTTKRRKTEQVEGNSGEKDKNRVGVSNKDVVNDEKHSKADQKNETSGQTSERKQRQTNRQDSNENSKIPQIGAVTRSRIVRKPKRDFSPPPSPVKKPAKEPKANNTPETKQKRQWELWSVDDKDAFFEGLFEFGKDFEAIQNFIAQKYKKKGINSSVVKNKDQVRHFYYRTWHKISKFIQHTPDVKKESQEIYGLINYGVLRKRIKGLTEKTGAKLNDLVHNGYTTVKVKGKNFRIKTPICPALKKLNNIDTTEHKVNTADRIPNKIQVEMSPKTNAAWTYIQEMAFNPRIKLMLKPNRTLSSVITYLSQKWKSHRSKLKENIPGAEAEPVPLLTVYPHPDCDITPLTLKATTEPKINITFSDYRENMVFNSPSVSKEKKGETTKTTSTIHSENSHSIDFMDPKNGMFESPKSKGTARDNKCGMTPTSLSVYGVDAAFLSEGENAMFPDTPLSKNDSKSTENLTETDSTDGSPSVRTNLSGGNESEAVKNSSSDNEEKCSASEKEDQESINIKEALEKGWTSSRSENLTIAQLYLMLGKDSKIRLEYDFSKDNSVEDIVKTQLTNTLRRLVHLAVMEITDVKVSGSSSSSPCHTCGSVRAKATKGCVRGQRAASKNPLASRADGLVDVATQTTFKITEPINSSQCRDPVFRVPVAGASFLQKSTIPGIVPVNRSFLNQPFSVPAPGYRNGKRIRQVNRKPMVVQRTILPKAPNFFTVVQPPGSNMKTVINVPNSIPVLSNPSTTNPVCTLVKAVQLDVQSRISQPTFTIDPSQPRTITPSHIKLSGSSQIISLGPDQLPVKLNEIAQGNIELPPASTVNVFTTSIATNHTDVVTTASTPHRTLSPPSISNLLDMSFSNFGTPGTDGEKLFDMALGTGSSFGPLLDEGTNKETVLDVSTPKPESVTNENSFRNPTWINGEVGDISFMSLLNDTSKQDPVVTTSTLLQPQALFFENSRDSSIMGKFDVDQLMNESSLDFVAKFADLQALTQEDPVTDLGKKTVSNG